ncbi:MAG: bifunctional DNA-formamidopyrimidine glycosylase/DNA-(apurinic or apyrimidinic site) lyase [candidate division Zixibacteria bacterium]|nr:bifunctional DNA-formamidopyrimidine glycosylase/DNA-(apurinic or apyrimidinic site) lyase [candidate division Zixibacteria bacterium]
MPELPEVETVVRGLRPILEGRTFARVRSYAPPASIVVSKTFRRAKLESLLAGRTVEKITRRGKNILIALSGDATLWIHLKMTGKLISVSPLSPRDKHDLVLFDLAPDGSPSGVDHLRFNDYRRFGRLRLYPNDELWQQDGLRDLGPEPLEISADDFVTLCHTRTRMIKPALLDQSFVAGIGNIYADESLYLSRIHPSRLTSTLSKNKLKELHHHIQSVLKRSIKMLGTTVISYAGVDGASGSFQKMLRVYGRESEPCGMCGAKIVRQKLGARSAHFCPRCQRLR